MKEIVGVLRMPEVNICSNYSTGFNQFFFMASNSQVKIALSCGEYYNIWL